MRTGPCRVWGVETPGPLELIRIPDVIVPECVSRCANGVSVMACVSACMEMDDGRIQKGDGNGEPGRPHEVVLETAPAPQDAVCEVRSVFCERPKRARLRDRKPALKCLVHGTKPARAPFKGRLCEFGKHGSPCKRMCGASRAARRVFCSRNA